MKQTEKGVALLVTLMIIALMAALAAEMTTDFQTRLQRTRLQNNRLKATYGVLFAEAQAQKDLLADFTDNPKQTMLNQQWAQPQKVELPDDISVSWHIVDNQSCFNLNALDIAPVEPLATPPWSIRVFMALLESLGAEKARSEEIVQSIADYIDTDDMPRLRGAEDEWYQSTGRHGQTSGQRLFLVSELRNIKGMNDDIYQKLLPLVCTPQDNTLAININTLGEKQAPLLAALFVNDITQDDAVALIRKRPASGWPHPDAFLQQAEKEFVAIKPLSGSVKKTLAVTSDWFRVESTLHQESMTMGMNSFLHYDRKTKTVTVYQRQLALRG